MTRARIVQVASRRAECSCLVKKKVEEKEVVKHAGRFAKLRLDALGNQSEPATANQ